MVGRLVQQEQVRAAHHGLGQQHAAFHAGGKRRHRRVRLEAHPRQDGLDLLVHVPAAVGLQGVLDAAQFRLQGVVPLSGQPAGQAMILGQQIRPGAEAADDLVPDRALQFPRHFLREHGGPQSLLADDFAVIGLDGAVEDSQQRRLSGAVAAQQAHPFARLDREIGPIQDRRPAEGQGDIG